jgi:dTDP-glucose 4,6-dehydratase
MTNILQNDLEHILNHTRDLWEELRGKRIFITGGTAFIGCWLLESFVWANTKLKLDSSALVLTRNPEAFRSKALHLYENPAIQFHTGDVRNFEFPQGEFSYIIHAALGTDSTSAIQNPLPLFEGIVQGTRRTLEFAKSCNASKFLFTISGAVYGKQPNDITHISEDYEGAPITTELSSAYGEGKRAAEFLCGSYSKQFGFEAIIARCFTFVGPYLPLNETYAVGNFIGDALQGGTIRVKGDGTPYRSYLYAADLAIWLWTILFQGVSCRPYNVGSENFLSISSLAEIVSKAFHPQREIRILAKAMQDKPIDRYVP